MFDLKIRKLAQTIITEDLGNSAEDTMRLIAWLVESVQGALDYAEQESLVSAVEIAYNGIRDRASKQQKVA